MLTNLTILWNKMLKTLITQNSEFLISDHQVRFVETQLMAAVVKCSVLSYIYIYIYILIKKEYNLQLNWNFLTFMVIVLNIWDRVTNTVKINLKTQTDGLLLTISISSGNRTVLVSGNKWYLII